VDRGVLLRVLNCPNRANLCMLPGCREARCICLQVCFSSVNTLIDTLEAERRRSKHRLIGRSTKYKIRTSPVVSPPELNLISVGRLRNRAISNP